MLTSQEQQSNNKLRRPGADWRQVFTERGRCTEPQLQPCRRKGLASRGPSAPRGSTDEAVACKTAFCALPHFPTNQYVLYRYVYAACLFIYDGWADPTMEELRKEVHCTQGIDASPRCPGLSIGRAAAGGGESGRGNGSWFLYPDRGPQRNAGLRASLLNKCMRVSDKDRRCQFGHPQESS